MLSVDTNAINIGLFHYLCTLCPGKLDIQYLQIIIDIHNFWWKYCVNRVKRVRANGSLMWASELLIMSVFVCVVIVVQDERLVWLISSWQLGQGSAGLHPKVHVWHWRKVFEWNWKVYDQRVWRKGVVWSAVAWPERDQVASCALDGAILWLRPIESLDH